MIIYVPYLYNEERYNAEISRLNNLLASAEDKKHEANITYYKEQLNQLATWQRFEVVNK